MNKPTSSRIIVVPLLILFGLMALFGVVELRKMTNEDTIKKVFTDPVSAMVQEISTNAIRLQSALAQYHLSQGLLADTLEMGKRARDKISERSKALELYIQSDDYVDPEEHTILTSIAEVKSLAASVDFERELASHHTDADYADHAHQLELLLAAAQRLNESMTSAHDRIMKGLFEQFERDEKDRAVLAIFVLIGGFIVMLSLFDLVYHYKTHAEKARAAERYNALFAAALQNTRVGVLIRDMRREHKPVVFINKAFTKLTGYEFEDLKGDSSDFLFGWNTEQSAIMSFRRAVHLHETTTITTLLYKKDGTPFWAEWHLTPILGDDQTIHFFVSIFSDVTGIKQVQEDLTQAKLMAEHASAVKTTFLAMMSHEIRTPINGILGVLKLLNDTRLEDEQRHLLGIAHTSSSALHAIINDILDYAKMEAGKIEILPEPFDLRELVENVAALGQTLLGNKAIEMSTDVDATIPGRLVGDITRIRQILLNLVSNAAKFTESGFIRIRVYPLMQQEVEGKPGFLMRFEVQDSGMGISATDQTKLFQEFSQTDRSFARRFGGTGLGLAICRRLVILMNGEMDVESSPGKGSKFWFMIPIQEITAAEHDLTADAGSAGADANQILLEDIRILLVEDNDTNRLVARKYIEKTGLSNIDEAVNGIEAIEQAKKTAYNLILMDVSMPEMDGMVATCQIRALGGHNASVPVIALTAHAMQGDKQLCLAAGMNDYLNKPVDYSELVKMLERWLRVRLAHDAPGSGKTASSLTQTPPAAQPPKQELIGAEYDHFPLFDSHVLEVMHDDLGGTAVDQVTRVFLEDSGRRMENFKTETDQEALRNASHTLKSCSANCGLIRFSKIMADLEAASAAGDRLRMDKLAAHASVIYQISKDTLEKERVNFLN